MNPPTKPFLNPSFTFRSPNHNPYLSYLSLPNPPNPPPLFPSNPYPSTNPNFFYPSLPPQTPDPPLLPPNPNPNPNPNISCPPLPHSEPSDIKSTISTLKHFIDLAQTTLKSTFNVLHLSQNHSPNSDFCVCPFDSRHRMPPESLFRHFLCCPSSPAVVDLALLDSLHYPNSLRAQKENRFRSLLESDADLCLSLDEYGDLGGLNFFYKDCPGVVSSSEQDTSKRTFTLPSILSVECANFICSDGDREIMNLSDYILKLRILPSELWTARREIYLWGDYPSSYSYSVVRVASCLGEFRESDIRKWIISYSPWYGIVIDVHVRDHIFVILKLCLKAVWREAFRSLELLLGREVSEGNGFLNLKSMSFECPCLVEVLGWLASQLSILYGDANGKAFAISMLKQCLLSAGMGSLLFPIGQKTRGDDILRETCVGLDCAVDDKGLQYVELKASRYGTLKELAENEKLLFENKNLLGGGLLSNGEVFVSQVAAAVAALHERTLLEERIKGLRFGRQHSKFHLINEHANLSMMAIEERGKRPDYRPLLEHDGLLWQRAHNPDSSKNKTREELLAEERDYKRRRMSYRGKKVKRSTTQVMRDIIDGHMEEIKQAGGIGCFIKGYADTGMFKSGSLFAGETTTDVDEFRGRGSGCNSSETSRSCHAYEKEVHSGYNDTSTRIEDVQTEEQYVMSRGLNNSHYRPRHENHKDNEDGEHQSRSPRSYKRHCSRKDEEHRSRSPRNYRSHLQSHERLRRQREQDDTEMTMTSNKYERSDSFSYHRSKHCDDRTLSSSSNLTDDFSMGKYDRLSESNDRYGGRTDGNCKSQPVIQNMFEDRYDPSGYDMYDATYDDDSCGSRYVRPDKLHSPDYVKHHKKLPKLDQSSKGYHHDYRKKS